MSKNEIVVVSKEELRELIKEAIESTLLGAEVVVRDNSKETEKEVAEEKTNVKKDSKKAPKQEEAKEVEPEVDEEEDAYADIKELTYNDLKKKAKELGLSAVGKRDDLLARVIEALEGSESVEDGEETNESTEAQKPAKKSNKGSEKASKEKDVEEDEEDEWDEEEKAEIFELLNGLKKPEVIEIGEKMGEEAPAKYVKRKFIDLLMSLREELLDALEDLGYIDSEDADEEDDEEITEADEEVTLAEELEEWTLEELADACKENGLSAKGKKQSLIDRLVKAIEDGEIEEEDVFGEYEDEDDSEDDQEVIDADYEDADDEEDEEDWYSREELEEMSDEELEEIAEEEEVEIPTKKVKKGKKKVSVLDREALIEAILELGEEELDEDEDDSEEDEEDDDFEPTEERLEAEATIEEDIRKEYKAKKLKDAKIKSFLTKYNEGNPDFDPKKLKKDEALEEYINIQKSLVDDDGEVFDLGDVYIRDNMDFCCGKPLSEKGDSFYCAVCGAEYEA